MYITNKYGTIKLPVEPGLLEWLQQNYPFSKYFIMKETNETDSSKQKPNS